MFFTHESISTAGRFSQTKPPNPQHQFVHIDGQFHQVQGNGVTYPHTYALYYDPLEDYLAWHGIASNERHSRQVSIHLTEIEGRRVWTRAQFDDWFVSECKNTVYVQRVTDVAWTLTFVDIVDQMKFHKWWFESRSNQRFAIKPLDRMTTEGQQAWAQTRAEMIEWFKETIHGNHRINAYNDLVNVEFEEDSEALLFKLKWMDHTRIDMIK